MQNNSDRKDEVLLTRSVRGFRLPYYFELFEKKHFILSESSLPDRYLLWLFKEKLHNGNYVRYTLSGKALAVGDAFEISKAYLYAKLSFHPYDGTTNVFIEDIITGIRGKHIGTFMMNTFIEFLRKWDTFFFVDNIKGELSLVNETDLANRERRNAFYRKFGFSFEEKDTSRYISATLNQLHIREMKGIKILSWEEVHKLLARAIQNLNFD